jgi:ketosteroid isomerase-like protein
MRSHRGAIRRRTLAACAAVLLALVGNAQPASSRESRIPPDLQKSVEAYNRATLSSDVVALSTIVANDYVLVNSDASVQDKASYLADFEVPGFRIKPYTIENPIFRVTHDAALTAWSFQLSWAQNGADYSRRLRISHFWVKRGGRWRIAYTQLTRAP